MSDLGVRDPPNMQIVREVQAVLCNNLYKTMLGSHKSMLFLGYVPYLMFYANQHLWIMKLEA